MSSGDDPNSPLTAAKARLTDAEKRQNHIASEKKRRDAIRAGFDKICDIVPEMKGQGRSEAVVLQATVLYMKAQLEKKEQLKKKAMAKGMSESDFEEVYHAAYSKAKVEQEEEDARAESERVAAGEGPDGD